MISIWELLMEKRFGIKKVRKTGDRQNQIIGIWELLMEKRLEIKKWEKW